MSEQLLEVRDLAFWYYPDYPILDGAAFALASGDRVALVGHNGSGKSTLLRLLVGLQQPNRGEIVAFGAGRSTDADFHEVRRRVGLVFQDADDQLFCPTVIEDVAFGPLNLGRSGEEARAIAEATLERLGMSAFAERIIYNLSGGEKRLIALATVLAMEPDVLLLDEPTSNLDEGATRRLVETLDSLPQAMILVSHHRQVLEALANRVLHLHGGRIHPADDLHACCDLVAGMC